MKLTTLTAAFALAGTAAFAADKTLDIGVSDALTGGAAVYGLPQANAVQMAADEINASGGIKAGDDVYMLNVIAYDDKANPTEASNSVRKLLDRDGVKYILGFCCSGATGAVASFIENEDAVMLVGNAAERSITTREIPNLTRTRPPADYTGAAAGAFVAEKGHKKVAVAMSQMWKQTLGVETNLSNLEWKVFLEARGNGDFQLARGAWCGDYNEASTFLDLLQSDSGYNDGKFNNARVDELMKGAKTSDDTGPLYTEVEQIIATEVPVIPIYHYAGVYMMDSDVGNWPVNNVEQNWYSKNLYKIAE